MATQDLILRIVLGSPPDASLLVASKVTGYTNSSDVQRLPQHSTNLPITIHYSNLGAVHLRSHNTGRCMSQDGNGEHGHCFFRGFIFPEIMADKEIRR